MKTVNRLLSALGIASVALVALVGVALAHGTPELTVQQTTVRAEGTLTLSGDALGENGDTVTISLQGSTYQATLGTATLKDDTFDNVEFTIPTDTPAGMYIVTAKNGPLSATAQIEVTAAAAATGATMATAQAPVITRTWTPAEWIVSVGLLVLTLLVALLLLWRHRVELTAIDL